MSCSRMQGSLIVISVYYTTVSICSLCDQSRIIIVESSWLFIGRTIGPHHSRNRYQIASRTNFASFQLVVSICVDLPEFSNSNRIESDRGNTKSNSRRGSGHSYNRVLKFISDKTQRNHRNCDCLPLLKTPGSDPLS